ncbi:MAG: hypothetical protein HY720_11205, partial [Planctomycetes bacterium]|nr:hypothetical protein [Planctomycetota bacterium]
MGLFLICTCFACALAGCNSGPATRNSGATDGDLPDPTQIDPPEPYAAGDREYYIEARRIYLEGTETAWEEKKAEILQTKGRQGAEFLIALLAIGEQTGTTEERMEYAVRELAHVVRYWAQEIEKDDWPIRWFVIQFFVNPNSGATFHSTVWLPVCRLVGPPIYPYVKSLLNHPNLKELWRLEVYQGMGGCGGVIAVPDLVAIIRANGGDEGQPTRVACMQGLGITYAVEAIEPLKEGLRDPDEMVRDMALDGILEIAS